MITVTKIEGHRNNLTAEGNNLTNVIEVHFDDGTTLILKSVATNPPPTKLTHQDVTQINLIRGIDKYGAR